MELRQSNVLLALKEAQTFLDAHPAQLAAISQSGTRRKLDQTLAELTALASAQSANDLAARAATQRVRVLTRTVLDHMAPIARIAAAELPAVELAPLAMPQARETGERLVAIARGMATQAAKFVDTFIHAGLPEDFVAQLENAADALAAMLTERKQRQAQRGAATKYLGKRLAEAGKLVNVLDAFVKKAAVDNPALFAAWKIVKRQRRPRVITAPLPAPATTAPFDAIGGAE